MRRIVKKVLFFFCILLLCISCTTSRQLLFDGRGAGEVRKDIGRIEGIEYSVETSTELIEGYCDNIKEGVEREGSLIEELRRFLQYIRERGDGLSK